ncbi:Aspartic peptidase domain superfamily [Arabidopsis thaliana x Arabidopsis arenosa]|uniref:Aspartic peptidase domain superfamily n=1 Tax=Arabidopsis thaliana x Arabidopsis arenosa TaxID=1240361 RepID=A0A8T1Z2F3_9BRAS|nr:Aspartic peptidase domain superfamily [Arabidopsis thaliana x Arabidopsis arenosa]
MTRSQNSGVPPYQDIGRLEREIQSLQRQQLMADQRNPRDGDLGPQHQQVPALDENGQPYTMKMATPSTNSQNKDSTSKMAEIPTNVVNAQHPLNVATRHAAYVPPLRRAAPHRTIADYDAPNQYPQDRAAIRVPNPPRRDYEIKPQIISLVKQNKFHGLNTEHPMDHIDLFEEICSTTQSRGVPDDYLKYTASNGDFTTNTVQEGRDLIENLPTSNSNASTDFDRTTRSNDSDAKQIAELKGMMNQLLRNQNRAVNACETIGNGNAEAFQEFDDSFNQEEEVNYVGTQGFYQNRGYNNNFNNNFRNTSNLSYRNPNVENPQDQRYPQPKPFQNASYGGNNFQPRAPFNNNNNNNNKVPFQAGPVQAAPSQGSKLEMMMQELLASHHATSRDINVKIENIYGELNGKFESLSTHVKKLEIQVAQTSEAVKRQAGVLPGRAEENYKGYCNAISAVPALHNREAEPLVPLFDSHDDMIRMTRVIVEDTPERYPLRRLTKVEDPGRFVCSCSITGIEFPNPLCDSGANVNVMSRNVAEKLGLRDLSPSNLSLVFGDSSQKTPDGLVRDLQLVVGDCIVPTDFYILEMDKKTERPLILGRPFLATVGAAIDHNHKKTIFAKINKKISYPTISKTIPS